MLPKAPLLRKFCRDFRRHVAIENRQPDRLVLSDIDGQLEQLCPLPTRQHHAHEAQEQ